MRIIFLFLLSSLSVFSQTDIKLDNNFTGILSTNKTTSMGFNFIGNNSLSVKKISIDLTTNYSIRLSPNIKENEFSQRQNLGYELEKWDAFITYQYNYSLIRQIRSDNWIGVGSGLKFKLDCGKISFSYATIYQNSDYFDKKNESLIRHSFRTKLKFNMKNISFYTEYFFQPNFYHFNDLIIYGSSKLSLFENKPMNFIIQDVVNWRSTSNVKLIHNLSLGISYKFGKSIKRKNE